MTENIEKFPSDWNDKDLEDEILRVQNAIRAWAVSRELWFDCSFVSYLEHQDSQPDTPPVITRLCYGGDFLNVALERDMEFCDFLEELGYELELCFGYADIYPINTTVSSEFEDYFHWQWVCSLIKEDTADVYEELYSHFREKPNDLMKLHWRDFELLLFRIFQSQGFEALIGPGQGDEGIDLKLWLRGPLGDSLTVVQAKRYAEHRKIGQTDVAALFGASVVEEADKALFVTTSSYAPVSKRWAARTSEVLSLADKSDIIKWCEQAERGIINDKSSLVSIDHISHLLSKASATNSKVVHTSWGYNMTHNNFALVVKESHHAALLLGLANQKISDDGYGQRGYEAPRFEVCSTKELLSSTNVWRAKRISDNGRVSYWDGENLYSQWNGQPAYFDYVD